MAMLERYRKPGGFVQLLSLIETCSATKQEKLLETVATEDRVWAQTIRSKMLNINRVFSWTDEALMEVLGGLQDLTVAVTIQSAQEPLKSRISMCIPQIRRRKIEDLFGSNAPSPGEIMAMHMKIVETVRRMGSEGTLRFEKIDPDLVIDEDIDDRLLHPSGPARQETSLAVGSADSVGTVQAKLLHSYSPMSAHQAALAPAVSPAATGAPRVQAVESADSRVMETQLLKKRVADLSKENAVLRHELAVVRSKLDQIKKIA